MGGGWGIALPSPAAGGCLHFLAHDPFSSSHHFQSSTSISHSPTPVTLLPFLKSLVITLGLLDNPTYSSYLEVLNLHTTTESLSAMQSNIVTGSRDWEVDIFGRGHYSAYHNPYFSFADKVSLSNGSFYQHMKCSNITHLQKKKLLFD